VAGPTGGSSRHGVSSNGRPTRAACQWRDRPQPLEGSLMVRRLTTRFGVAISVVAIVLSLSASAALAGEVTGSGKKINQNQGMSWCSFSGLNDRIEGEGPTDTQAQSFGQDVKSGNADPHLLIRACPAIRITRRS